MADRIKGLTPQASGAGKLIYFAPAKSVFLHSKEGAGQTGETGRGGVLVYLLDSRQIEAHMLLILDHAV